MITSGSAADREPPNPSGLARITLVAQILLLSPMQSSLHLHNELAGVMHLGRVSALRLCMSELLHPRSLVADVAVSVIAG
jgi:hypothetical protein